MQMHLKKNEHSARGLVVMIVACQVMDPGSIPGERNFFLCFFVGCFYFLHSWLYCFFLISWSNLFFGYVKSVGIFYNSAVLAEWLRRMLKAHVRKSVGSIPTDCNFLCPP